MGRNVSEEKSSFRVDKIAVTQTTQPLGITGLFSYTGKTAADASMKGVQSDSITLGEAAKRLGMSIAALIALTEKVTDKRARCQSSAPFVATWMKNTHSHNGVYLCEPIFPLNHSQSRAARALLPRRKMSPNSKGTFPIQNQRVEELYM